MQTDPQNDPARGRGQKESRGANLGSVSSKWYTRRDSNPSHITTDTKKKAIEALPTLTIDAEPVPAVPAIRMLDEKRQQLLAAIEGVDEKTLDELLKKARAGH